MTKTSVNIGASARKGFCRFLQVVWMILPSCDPHDPERETTSSLDAIDTMCTLCERDECVRSVVLLYVMNHLNAEPLGSIPDCPSPLWPCAGLGLCEGRESGVSGSLSRIRLHAGPLTCARTRTDGVKLTFSSQSVYLQGIRGRRANFYRVTSSPLVARPSLSPTFSSPPACVSHFESPVLLFTFGVLPACARSLTPCPPPA